MSLQTMHTFSLFSAELRRSLAQLSLVTEVTFVYLHIKHVSSHSGQALSRHMHGKICMSQLECRTDPSSVCLVHFDVLVENSTFGTVPTGSYHFLTHLCT